MSIGEKIRLARKQQGLSVKELSDESGVPEKTIYRIETGEVQDPKILSIKPIIKTLNCSADEILFDKDDYYALGELRQCFANASELQDEELETLVTMVRKYIFACSMEKQIAKNMMPLEKDKGTISQAESLPIYRNAN